MSDSWLFLRDDETVVWEGTPRLSAAIGGITAGTVIVGICLVAAVTVDPRLAAASLVGIGIIAWSVLRIRHTKYVITTRAVWLKRGVPGRTVRRVGLSQVQNTAYSQSVTGSTFGYGTVSVEVAGGPDVTFRRIDDPETVRQAITGRIGGDGTEIPGTVEQWKEVLAIVRDLKTAVE
ncbi:PH domain-containing protein [Halorubrum sp. BOL3-1]|uniref:PH domain-containing protein n=1 Tax=Halorubrum sp. BOL3-1 TaxID=2497325 RepID=UPI001004D970|nr:PH domain-containing protein [Halorubrum sp. BOL3-1]QAU14102.1 PH domain-containing protein [Halorubrum sp. BOL3-1]